MSSLRRTLNQSAREGTSMRRHALSGPTTKSMKTVVHANAVPVSPLRHRSKYELRSISLEGNKVLPWTTRSVDFSVSFFFSLLLSATKERSPATALPIKLSVCLSIKYMEKHCYYFYLNFYLVIYFSCENKKFYFVTTTHICANYKDVMRNAKLNTKRNAKNIK